MRGLFLFLRAGPGATAVLAQPHNVGQAGSEPEVGVG